MANAEIERLAERRRALRAESERLRRQLADQAEELERVAGWVESGVSVARSLAAWWPLAAGATGFLIARKRGGWLRSLGGIWSVWRIVRQFVPHLRRFLPTKRSGSSPVL